jgi:hypothetical protein
MSRDEHGNHFVTMVQPSTPRNAARPPARPVSLCKGCGEAKPPKAVDGGDYHPLCNPTHPLYLPSGATPERASAQQDTKAVVVTAMNDQRPSPRRPLRRAWLDQHGNAITWTDTGVIINDLEIIHEPTRDEASREIAARQRKYMFGGMAAREALTRVLAEIPPVYRNAYMR